VSGGARPGNAPAPQRTLGVVVDGQAMPPTEAREFWGRFSAYMEANKGDLAGFAKQEGFASVHPSMKDGAAVLLASRSSAQRPYAAVKEGSADPRGGSSDHQGAPRDPGKGGGKRRKGPKRRP
jgi:hypothetical protein